jgi:glyoxylase-like metal-dependent hydrolase (beta-lactamase superfamily II)
MISIEVLKEGKLEKVEDKLVAECTITLIRGEKNILVDTGGCGDADAILAELQKRNLEPNNIDIVITTHNHPDHTWNNYLFSEALFFCAGVMQRSNQFWDAEKNWKPMDGAKVIHTPGHSPDDYTILAQTDKGKIAIVGDLIMNEKTRDRPGYYSQNSELQKQNQQKILAMADFIVPGHGAMFGV